jgi:hypothetical protein
MPADALLFDFFTLFHRLFQQQIFPFLPTLVKSLKNFAPPCHTPVTLPLNSVDIPDSPLHFGLLKVPPTLMLVRRMMLSFTGLSAFGGLYLPYFTSLPSGGLSLFVSRASAERRPVECPRFFPFLVIASPEPLLVWDDAISFSICNPQLVKSAISIHKSSIKESVRRTPFGRVNP